MNLGNNGSDNNLGVKFMNVNVSSNNNNDITTNNMMIKSNNNIKP